MMTSAITYRMKPGVGARLIRGHALTRGLVGCWLMNERGGQKVYDAAGYGHDGALYGNTSLGVGRSGCVLEMDGNGGYVRQAASGVLDTTANDERTICARIYLHSLAGYPYAYVVSQGTAGSFDYHVRLNQGYLQAGNSDGATTCFSTALEANRWYHIAVVYSTGGAIGYVNGVAGTLVNRKTKASNSGNYLDIGRLVPGVGYFDGLIDHVMIYRRALSGGEIRRLCRDPFGLFEIRRLPVRVPRFRKTATLWSGGQIDTDRRWLGGVLFNGAGSEGFKLGTVLTGGWFWMRRSGCVVLYRGDDMGHIDFANILLVVSVQGDTISVASVPASEGSSTCFYVVRRFNSCGYDERTLGGAVRVSFDETGQLCEAAPNRPVSLTVDRQQSDRVRLRWCYCPLGQRSEPSVFRLYSDGQSGQVDYEAPIAVVDYRGRGCYEYLSDALDIGTYLFAMGVAGADGAEVYFQRERSVEIKPTSPGVVDVLSAEGC